MSHDSAAIFVSHGLGPAGMIEVTVSQQKVFELHIRFQAFGDVFSQLRLISPTSGINKGCFVAEAYEVDGGVRGISQPSSAHLPEIIPDSCDHSDPLFVRCKYAIRFAADHAECRKFVRLHGYLPERIGLNYAAFCHYDTPETSREHSADPKMAAV